MIFLITMIDISYIMNLVVVNASPRKKGNTAKLCKKVVDGAMDNGAMLNSSIFTAMILRGV